jgi:hypothetical protein
MFVIPAENTKRAECVPAARLVIAILELEVDFASVRVLQKPATSPPSLQ